MSAFVMSPEFFNQLGNEIAGRIYSPSNELRYALSRFLGINLTCGFNLVDKKAQKRVQSLLNANVRAVNMRYSESPDGTPWNVAKVEGFVKWSDIQFYKYLQCLRYQMAEGDVPSSALYAEFTKLIHDIAETLLAYTDGYKQAKWA